MKQIPLKSIIKVFFKFVEGILKGFEKDLKNFWNLK